MTPPSDKLLGGSRGWGFWIGIGALCIWGGTLLLKNSLLLMQMMHRRVRRRRSSPSMPAYHGYNDVELHDCSVRECMPATVRHQLAAVKIRAALAEAIPMDAEIMKGKSDRTNVPIAFPISFDYSEVRS